VKPDRILEILCKFLMQPECTKDIAECFPQLLPALISMAIFADDVQSSTLFNNDLIHRLNCVILGKLVTINPDLLTYVFDSHESNKLFNSDFIETILYLMYKGIGNIFYIKC